MMRPPFDYVVGTGGLGKGILFNFQEARTLGRNESRLAELSDTEDFCKLHIILHYIAVFAEGTVPVYAVGMVGSDEAGVEVLRRMAGAGIHTGFVGTREDARTLFSVCYLYPNGEGGNITAGNSASRFVSGAQIERFFGQVPAGKRGVVIAAPEVPIAARASLLKAGRRHGCFNSASLLASEAQEFLAGDAITDTDLLAVNQEEAAAIAGPEAGKAGAGRCYEKLQKRNRQLILVVTKGAQGSELFTPRGHWIFPAFKSTVCSTAGAGDSFLATLLWGMMNGLPLEPGENDGEDAVTLASACAAMKVQSRHSINFEINRQSLCGYLEETGCGALQKAVAGFPKGTSLHSIRDSK